MAEQPAPIARPAMASGLVLAGLACLCVLCAVLSAMGLSGAGLAAILVGAMLAVCAAGPRIGLPWGGTGNGALLAVEALSAFGIFAIMGGVFVSIGGGAAVVLGLTAGFAIALLLLEPGGSVIGVRSLPDQLSLRYRSEAVRYVILAACACAAILLIAAQLAAGGWVAAQVIGITSIAGIVVAGLAIVLLTLRAAGDPVRNATGVLALAALFGLGIVTVWLMAQKTGIVVPQVAFGGLLQDISAREATLGMPSRPYAVFGDAASTIGIAIGAGIGSAVLLQLLRRSRSSESGGAADGALRSGALWFAAVASMLPALGVLVKVELLGRFGAAGGEPVTNLFLHGARSGGAALPLDALSAVQPQAVPMTLPALSGASGWLTGLLALSVMAALTVAGAGVLRMLLAACVSRLIPAEAEARSRFIGIAAVFIAACIAVFGASVLTLGALAYALLAASVFVPLFLGLRWPRATGAGALAGIIGGAVTVAVFVILGAEGLDLLPVGAVGVLVSLLLAVVVSLMTAPVEPPAEDSPRRFGLIADPELLE